MAQFPKTVGNFINNQETDPQSGEWLDNLNPHNGESIGKLARSGAEDVKAAVAAAQAAQPAWAATPPVQRGMMLHKIVRLMQDRTDEIAELIAAEAGKNMAGSKGEVGAAVQCGLFFASEGQRLYGKTTTTGMEGRAQAMTVRRPLGVAGLIIAANTPMPNVAWKVFPALVCGNSVVLKSAEDSPLAAWIFGEICREAGLPEGVLNIVHGYGHEAGQALIENQHVDIVSFTGSTRVGRIVREACAKRFARCSLELGGKNPLVVCDDADLDNACKWVINAAFSNAGQRCAAASRVIIFDSVYDKFREMLKDAASKLTCGVGDGDYLGPVINGRQLNNMTSVVKGALANGATALVGGERLSDDAHASGFYMAPTFIEGAPMDAPISREELFGPIACLYRVKDFEEALAMANDCDYGLTSCIHTSSLHRAMRFAEQIKAGVASINAGTHGSEPHMPFGGYKQSGNGTREPGTEALDVYSELQDVYINILPDQL